MERRFLNLYGQKLEIEKNLCQSKKTQLLHSFEKKRIDFFDVCNRLNKLNNKLKLLSKSRFGLQNVVKKNFQIASSTFNETFHTLERDILLLKKQIKDSEIILNKLMYKENKINEFIKKLEFVQNEVEDAVTCDEITPFANLHNNSGEYFLSDDFNKEIINNRIRCTSLAVDKRAYLKNEYRSKIKLIAFPVFTDTNGTIFVQLETGFKISLIPNLIRTRLILWNNFSVIYDVLAGAGIRVQSLKIYSANRGGKNG